MKTSVYIDSANIEFGCKNVGLNLSYKKLFIYLKNKFKTSDINYFVGYIEKRKYIYDQLASYGYIHQFKEVTTHKGVIKGNVDSEMVLKIVIDIIENKVERIALCSGDGDFSCLIKFAIERNVDVWVLAPDMNKCSHLIRKFSHKIKVVYLEKVSKDKLEIEKE